MDDLKKLFKKYKRQVRGFIGWFFGLVIQVTGTGASVDQVMLWDARKWTFTLGIAALPGIVGLMSVGEPNPTDEELYKKVHAVKKARAMEGLEVTGEHPLAPAPVLPPELPTGPIGKTD